MVDDKTNKGKADRTRINTSEPYEMQYWTKTLKCSSQQLVWAVRKVGPMVNDVKAYLKAKRGK